MSCFHPLKGFPIGKNPSGKTNYKITSYEAKYVKFDGERWIVCFDEIPSDKIYYRVTESIDIPCGHCIGCLLDRSRQWADRCMLESLYHDECCFITLTYDDEHFKTLHGVETINDDGVVDVKIRSLRKKDFQDFMKRLRFHYPDKKIRFFACGEYGSTTFRAHYHAILFGIDFHEDRQLLKLSFSGDPYYVSPKLERIWQNGFCTVCNLDWNCASYVARYCLKKQHNDLKEFYEQFELDPEFTLMSRKPGIARQYYEDHANDIYKTQKIYIGDSKGQKTIRPPRYFDKLYDVDYPSDFERIKNNRQFFAERSKEFILSETDLEYLDYLRNKEDNLKKRTKLLKERSVEK